MNSEHDKTILTNCPSDQELSAFSVGKLSQVRYDRIAEHVATCGDCVARLTRLDDTSDTLVSELRQPMAPYLCSDEDRKRAIELVAAIGRKPSTETQQAAQDERADDLDVKELGPYRVLAKLGQGGMGTVYKALHTRLEKVVAVKVLPADRMTDEAAVSRFEREMRSVGKLDHPNIVRATDADEDDGLHYLVMEFVDGLDLSEVVRQHGPLPAAEACELVRQSALGLEHAHEHGLVHRDIKPSNLMLTRKGVVKILDMGLALLDEPHIAEGKELTQSGQLMGTIDYMAPEQGTDTHHVDIRADIYSLGATLYKLLTGSAPFAGPKYDSLMKKLVALAGEEPTSVTETRPDLPPELVPLVTRMLAKSPDARFATPAEVARELEPLAAGADLRALLATATGAEKCDDATTGETSGPIRSSLSATEACRASSSQAATEPTVLGDPQPRAPQSTTQVSAPSADAPGRSTWWSRPRRLAVGALAAVVLLGVIIMVATKKGTVVVEGPDGKPLPNDVTVVLTGDGEEIEICAKDQWTVRAKPDEFQVTVRDSQDRFHFKGETLTVQRFGRTALKISRKAVAPAVGLKETTQPAASPFDQLRREDIDPYELAVAGMGDPPKAPPELVAIYGNSRLAHWSKPRQMEFDATGEIVVSRGSCTRVWERETGRQLACWPSSGFVLNPDRNLAAVGTPDGRLILWHIPARREQRSIVVGKTSIQPQSFSSDSRQVVVRDQGTLRVFSADDGAQLAAFTANPPPVEPPRFIDKDGAVLVIGEKQARVWDLVTGDYRSSAIAATAPCALSSDGTMFASKSGEDELTIWKLPGATELSKLAVPSVCRLWFSPDSETLLTVSKPKDNQEETVTVWDAVSGEQLRSFVVGGKDHAGLFVSPDGRQIIQFIAEHYERIRLKLFNANEGTGRLTDVRVRRGDEILGFSPDGKLMGARRGRNLYFVDVQAGGSGERLAHHDSKCTCAAVSSGGESLALGHVRTADIVSLPSGRTTKLSQTPAQNVQELVFSADGRYLAGRSNDGVYLWDTQTRELLQSWTVSSLGFGNSRIDFSPTEPALAIWGGNGKVIIWNAEKSAEQSSFKPEPPGPPAALAYHPDGTALFLGPFGYNWSARLWDPVKGVKKADINYSERAVHRVMFHPDGSLLAAKVGYLRDIRLLSTSGNAQPRHFNHIQDSDAFAFSPDGKTLATEPRAGVVEFWDVASGNSTGTIEVGPGRFEQLVYAPDGRHLITVNANGTVYVLRLTSGSMSD